MIGRVQRHGEHDKMKLKTVTERDLSTGGNIRISAPHLMPESTSRERPKLGDATEHKDFVASHATCLLHLHQRSKYGPGKFKLAWQQAITGHGTGCSPAVRDPLLLALEGQTVAVR